MLDAPVPNWEGYQSVYSKYPLNENSINIQLFTHQPSELYKKYFKKTHHFIGRCLMRSVNYRDQNEFYDETFLKFISTASPFQTIPLYTLTKPSVNIGYAEASKFGVVNSIVLEQALTDRVMVLWSQLYAPYLRMRFRDIDHCLIRVAKDTSCGWPLCEKFRQKSEALGDLRFMDAYMDYFDQMAGNDSYIPSIYTSSVKLELRKFEKVFNDQARTFMPCPMFQQLLTMQYYSAYDDSISENWNNLPFSMGFTDKYRGADKLVRWLKFEDSCDKDEPILFIESDVSAWDRTVQSPLMSLAFEMEKMSFPPEWILPGPHSNRLRNLFFDSVQSFIMLEKGDIFHVLNGMKSGDPSTLRRNSKMNIALTLAALIIMKPDITAEEILRFFRFKVQGDDFLAALRIKYCPWFSVEKWKAVVNKVFGFALKHVVASYKIEDVEFLGRKFKYSEWGCWLAYPDRNKMVDAYYIHRSSDRSAQLSKLLNLRQESWPDRPLFILLTKWCEKFFVDHNEEISIPKGAFVQPDGSVDYVFTKEKLRKQFLPEGAVRVLHVGF